MEASISHLGDEARASAEQFDPTHVVVRALAYAIIVGGATALVGPAGAVSAGGIAAVEILNVIKHKQKAKKWDDASKTRAEAIERDRTSTAS